MAPIPARQRTHAIALGAVAGLLALSGCAQFDDVSTMTATDEPTSAPTSAPPSPTPSESETPQQAQPAEASAAPAVEQRVDVYSLRVGDCFTEIYSEGDIVDEIGLVDCAAPHDYEVYAQIDLPEGTTLDTIDTIADDLCYEAFEEFTGAPWESSEYYYSYFSPSDESVIAGEEMWVDCLIYHETDLVEGSLRDSGYAEWANPNSDA